MKQRKPKVQARSYRRPRSKPQGDRDVTEHLKSLEAQIKELKREIHALRDEFKQDHDQPAAEITLL